MYVKVLRTPYKTDYFKSQQIFIPFKVHISTAITFAVEGFYPYNSAGYAIPTFQTVKLTGTFFR